MVTVPGFLLSGFLVPGLLVPGLLVPGLLVSGYGTNSYPRSRDRPGKTQQTVIFCGKALLLTSSGAREQESKRARKRTRARESKSARARARKRTRTRKQEREWQNPVPFKENYPPPRTYYSLIGCSPSAQLSSRERQNTWRENCPCTCADYVYHLEHSCQRHLIMANVRAAPNTSRENHRGKLVEEMNYSEARRLC